jgi:uncharacterized protein
MIHPHTPHYRAPAWLPGGHLQTIYAVLFVRRPRVHFRRERWELPDGDFLDADWVDGPADAPLVVLFHGLEGSSRSHYARSLMHHVRQLGWRGVVIHFRGCSGEPNRLPRAYFAGDSLEIDAIIRKLRNLHARQAMYVVGVSLGGNALLKWLGETGEQARGMVTAACAVSAPLDLTASGYALDQGINRHVYTRYFLASLKRKALAKSIRYPGLIDQTKIRKASRLWAFDTHYTARVHGFEDADDYWGKNASKPWLKHIAVPTLVINARNDPFLPSRALPSRQEVSDHVALEFTQDGGHVGFTSGPFPGNQNWMPRRVLAFFTAQPNE